MSSRDGAWIGETADLAIPVPNNSFLYSVHLIATCAVRDVIIRGPFEAFRPLNAGSDTSRLRDPARTFPSPSITFHPSPSRSFALLSLLLFPYDRFFLCFRTTSKEKGEERRGRRNNDG